MGKDYDQLKKERARRVTWIDESDDNSSIEEDQEVLNAQRVQRPTYVTIEQLDNRLKQVEYRLKKSQEQEKAKREHLFKDLESRCFQCGQTGHFKNECRTRFQAGKPQEKKPRACKGGNLREN